MAQPELLDRPAPRHARAARRRRRSPLAGGTEGNELLTSTTGAVLIVLLAIVGVTIIRIGSLLWVHLFVGVVLIGPLALKLSSTGYRFARYYTGNARYRQAGPPQILLRLLAPLAVLSTLAIFVSGIVMLFAGRSARATWFPVHKLSFFAWLAIMAVHVLGHLPAVGRALRSDYVDPIELGEEAAPGRSGRTIALLGAIVLGLVLAVLAIPEFANWTANQRLFAH